MLDLSKFYVVTPYANFQRWRTRKENYLKFKEHMRRSGVKLITVELALGERPFEVINTDDPLDRGIRVWDEMWHKEAQVNYGIWNVVPPNWEYLAWVDCDVEFVQESKWAIETVQLLQEFQWIQMWETAVNLGPNGEALSTNHSFMSQYIRGRKYNGKGYPYWHPGFAWAARREALEGVGGLMDFGVVGHGDHHMALALLGWLEPFFKKHPVSDAYKQLALGWQDRALDVVRKDVGFMPGTILHSWHGKKKDRRYEERLRNISPENFNPLTDILRGPNGMWRWSNLNSTLRDDHRTYFRGRNEDSNEAS